MLTAELIKQQGVLKDLTDAQIAAITTLSANDENEVIGKKVKEIHGAYDADMLKITGSPKPDGVKSYDYLKGYFDNLQKEKTTLEKEKADLEEKVKKNVGGDEAAKARIAELEKSLKDNETQLKDLQGGTQTKIDALKADYEGKLAAAAKERDALEWEAGLAGIEFADEKTIDKGVRDVFVKTTIARVMDLYKPDYMEKDGKKIRVFRDANGVIVTNPENLANPYTAREILERELKPIIKAGSGGGGGNPPGPNPKPLTEFNAGMFTGVTRVQAYTTVKQVLAAKGITAGSPKYQEEIDKVEQEFNLSALPSN